MDIQTVATTTLILLSPYLSKAGEAIAENLGEKLAEKVSGLYQTLQEKFRGDDYAEQTLARLEGKPESEGRQAALKEVLIEKMEADPDFAEQLRQLVEESKQVGGGDIISQHLNISGKAGDIFQIGKMGGGDITKK